MGGVGEKSELSYHTWRVLKPYIEWILVLYDVFAIGSYQACNLESKYKWFGVYVSHACLYGTVPLSSIAFFFLKQCNK
jgi:hypothetical protein